MAYATDVNIRMLAGNPSVTEVPAVKVTQFIVWADDIVDKECGGSAMKFQETIRFQQGRIRFLSLSKAFASVNRVFINNEKIPQYGRQILDDGGCEEGDSTDASPEFWTETEPTGCTATWSTTVHKGYRSLQLVTSAASSVTGKWTSDKVSVDESKRYHASAWISASSLTGTVNLRIRWLEDDGTTEIAASDSSDITSDQSYSETTVEAVAPNNAAYAEIQVVFAGTAGTVRGDEFTLRKMNWKADTSNQKVDFSRAPDFDDLIVIDYTLSSTDTQISLAADNIGAAFCMAYVTGIKSAGANFGELKSLKARVVPSSSRLFESLIGQAEAAIARFKRFENTENADLSLFDTGDVGFYGNRRSDG